MTNEPFTGLYVMDPERFDDVYGAAERTAIERHLTIKEPPVSAADLSPDLLAGVDVLVTGWGAPGSPPSSWTTRRGSPSSCMPQDPYAPWSPRSPGHAECGSPPPAR